MKLKMQTQETTHSLFVDSKVGKKNGAEFGLTGVDPRVFLWWVILSGFSFFGWVSFSFSRKGKIHRAIAALLQVQYPAHRLN